MQITAASPEAEAELSRLLSEPINFLGAPDSMDPSGDSGGNQPARRLSTRVAAPVVVRQQAPPTRKHSASLTSVSHLLSAGLQPCVSSQKRGIRTFADWRAGGGVLQEAAAVPPTLCAWTGILRAPSKRAPLGFVIAVWDSSAQADDASHSRKMDNGARSDGIRFNPLLGSAASRRRHQLGVFPPFTPPAPPTSPPAVMLEDFGNMLGLSMSLWMTKMDHDAKKLALSQLQLQRRFLVRAAA